MIRITEEMLSALRTAVSERIGDYRMVHTLGVEREIGRMAALYCPERENMLRAAALLHDVTKELTDAEQMTIFESFGVRLRPDEAASPKVWHGMTAALIIPVQYPDFADAELISAVRWHTTGHAGMSLCDGLVYLADLTEEGRSFPDCMALREAFWGAEPQKMPLSARRRHLRDVILLSLEKTLSRLKGEKATVCSDTLAALEELKNKTDI